MNNDHYQPFQISRNNKNSAVRTFGTTVTTIVGAIVMAIVLNMFVFQSYYVDGESMSPTLHTDNRLIVSKVERSLAALSSGEYIPERGQIVVINGAVSPATQANAPELIKRVIGIPGDTVTIKDGIVTITTAKGKSFNADTFLGLNLAPTYTANPMSVYVSDGTVFVLGDNRAEGGSHDSRAFGLVSTEYIDGRLWALIMPFDDRRVF